MLLKPLIAAAGLVGSLAFYVPGLIPAVSPSVNAVSQPPAVAAPAPSFATPSAIALDRALPARVVSREVRAPAEVRAAAEEIHNIWEVPQPRFVVPAPEPVAAAAPSSPLGFAGQPLGSTVPATIRRWEPHIVAAARKHDVDPNLIAALIQTESQGNPSARSPKNAIGLMQVLNGPLDPAQNVDKGTAMLKSHLKKYGSLDMALAAYNAGPGNVRKYGGMPPFKETQKHIARTRASYDKFTAAA